MDIKQLTAKIETNINKQLVRGDRGELVVCLQEALNAIGFNCGKVDGRFGFLTETQVENFQRKYMSKETGVVDVPTWHMLLCKLQVNKKTQKTIAVTVGTVPLFTDDQLKLIIKYEVGGGKAWYDKKAISPILPPYDSGCTIMIGVDLRYTSKQQFAEYLDDAVTEGIITKDQYNRLFALIGIKPSKAAVDALSDIKIPYEYAYKKFKQITVPYHWKITCLTFPLVQNLKWQAQVALLSLVFNRGGSLKGPRRVYMRKIKDLIPRFDYDGIAECIRAMKSWWPGPNGLGLRRRREDEALLVLGNFVG